MSTEEVKTGRCSYCEKERLVTELVKGSYWCSGSRSEGDFCKDRSCLQFMNMGGN